MPPIMPNVSVATPIQSGAQGATGGGNVFTAGSIFGNTSNQGLAGGGAPAVAASQNYVWLAAIAGGTVLIGLVLWLTLKK